MHVRSSRQSKHSGASQIKILLQINTNLIAEAKV